MFFNAIISDPSDRSASVDAIIFVNDDVAEVVDVEVVAVVDFKCILSDDNASLQITFVVCGVGIGVIVVVVCVLDVDCIARFVVVAVVINDDDGAVVIDVDIDVAAAVDVADESTVSWLGVMC